MKKKTMILALAGMVGASSLPAQILDMFPMEYGLNMQMGYESRHVFRGFKQADDVFSPHLEVSYGDTYFGWDGYFPMGSEDAGFQEHQFYAGIEFGIPRQRNFGIDLGTVVYEFPHQDGSRNHEFYAGLLYGNFDAVEGLEFSAYLRHDADIKHTIFQPGVSYQYDFENPQVPIRIRFDGFVGVLSDRKRISNYRDPEGERTDFKDSYNYYGGSAQVFFRIDPNATLGAGVHYEDAINQDEDRQPRDNNLFWTVNLTMGF